jgi:hypothetical protein
MRRVFLTILLLLCSNLVITPVSAQNPVPEISIDCVPKDVSIDIQPGSSRTNSIICTADNPSAFAEEVRIETSVSENPSVISITSPSSITVPASDDVDFTLTFKANQGLHAPITYSWNVTGTVTTANGITMPDAIAPSDTDGGDVYIEAYGRLSITMSTMTRYLAAGETANTTIEISNDGNDATKMGCTYAAEPVAVGGETYELIFDSNSHYEFVDPNSGYALSFNFTSPSPDDVAVFKIIVQCHMWEDDYYQTEEFKVEVEAAKGGGLSSLGNSLGIDDSTMMMVGGIGVGVVALLAVLIVGLKIKSNKRRHSNDDDWDDEIFEEEDDEFDFDDL